MKDWSLPGPDEYILSVKDVCAFLDTSRTKLFGMMKAKEFPMPRNIGGKSVWFGADIAAFLQLAGRFGGEETPDDPDDQFDDAAPTPQKRRKTHPDTPVPNRPETP